MKLSTIDMPRTEARARFLEYRRSVKERHDAEDEAIMRGYRELSRGRQLISLRETMQTGGLKARAVRLWGETTTRQLPRLAVMRASQRECYLHRNSRTATFTPEQWYRGRRDRIVVPLDGFKGFENVKSSDCPMMRAMVPIVPPALRPKVHLRNFHILWEAEWEQVDRHLPAPRDPALLKRISGDLFAVLAVWDLTEVERAVLAGRAV